MKKHSIIFAAALLVLASVAFTLKTTGYKVGDTATDFKLKNVDGKLVSLKDYMNAKGYIVIFTCNHCPYAKAYEQRIIDLDKKYAPQGYPVVAINPNDPVSYPDDSYENMVKRSKEKNYPFPYLIDETQDVAKAYGATKTPHVYLLDKSLKVQYIGAIDDNSESAKDVKDKYLEKAIAELQQGKPVAVSETKAVGCGIKWKKTN